MRLFHSAAASAAAASAAAASAAAAFAATALSLQLACAPVAPLRSSTRPDVGGADAASRALPVTVQIALDQGVGRRERIEFVDGLGARRTVVRTARGVAVDGGAPGPRVRARGPVRIGDALHRGDVLFEAVAGAPTELRAAAELPLESYVAGVVAAEIELWSAEPEELRAMAIAARTFAVRTLSTRGGGARLTDGVLDQAYRGAYVPPAGSARAREVLRRLDDAVDATRGTVLMRGSRLEDVRYHASCGGHTSDLDVVFRDEPDARAGSVGVASPPCEQRARAEFAARAPDPERPLGWMATLEREDLDRAARAAGLRPPLRALAAAERDRSGRWIRATLVDLEGTVATVSMNDLRRSLGFRLLPSAWIVALRPAEGEPLDGGPLLVQGRGRGHGVGLCQEGVRDLARRGWDHRRILAHYLPGARLARLDEIER